jgi:L-ascorbate metabolism protein UlaG (beta-lactamase superfamily)
MRAKSRQEAKSWGISRRRLLAGTGGAAALMATGMFGARAYGAPRGPHQIKLSWLSIANWLIEVGSTRVLIDGYITRLPGPPFFFGGGGGFAFTQAPALPDVRAVARVHQAIHGRSITHVLTGHSHWDHSFDTAVWAKLTGAPVIGSRTTALQAVAQGVPAAQCMTVLGGEVLDFGSGLTCRVIRTNHSGSNINPEQHDPVELNRAPVPDPATGGLRAGVAEDFPNGGGTRAYLFTVGNPGGPLSVLYTGSLSAFDLAAPIVVDGTNFGAPADNIAAAMDDAGLDRVDVWIAGGGNEAVGLLLLPIINPRAVIPNHWDGLFNSFDAGLPFPYSNPDFEALLDREGICLLPQGQYMDQFRLDESGLRAMPNHDVKHKLGFEDVQSFNGQQHKADRHECCCNG